MLELIWRRAAGHRTLRLTLGYLLAVLVLGSVDVTFEWFSPSATESGESVQWDTMVVGLRAGAVVLSGHGGKSAAGLAADVHAPRFLELPYFVAVGPDSGGVAVAVWLVAGVAWSVHALLRLRARRPRAA
ncbi:MAG TPA: hypothetical protein VFX28_23420 [Methylomirabilota bacterium]|nr:hypothetical protein [Methylomirabilota bacterium]